MTTLTGACLPFLMQKILSSLGHCFLESMFFFVLYPAAAIFIILRQCILVQLVLSWAISGIGRISRAPHRSIKALFIVARLPTSMMTNRWAMGYWAISSNDVIHNW